MEISKVTTSIIVLTKNSVSTIDKCLQSIFAQTKKPQEVLVIDGNSTDGTLEIVKKYPVKLSSEPGLGYGHARNLGVKNALSETIAFVDSDCILDKEYLSELLTTLLSSELTIGGVGVQLGVRVAGEVGAHGGDQGEVRAGRTLAALDAEAGFVRGIVRPGQVDLALGNNRGA